MQRQRWLLSDYAILEKLYTGYASVVYKASCKYSGFLVCLKIYRMTSLCEMTKYQVFREIKLHGSLHHDHIVQLYAAFQAEHQVVLVQEYVDGGDLLRLMQKHDGRLVEPEAVQLVLHPLLLTLDYLHQMSIIHRDVKPENILYTSDLCMKICDFGVAIDVEEESAVTRAGTLDYMAPEVLKCPYKRFPEDNKDNPRLHYSDRVDTWAVGILAYELLVGFPPFIDETKPRTESRIQCSSPVFPNKLSEQAKDFISLALSKDAARRPSSRDLLNHPWIQTHKIEKKPAAVDSPRSSFRLSKSSELSWLHGPAETYQEESPSVCPSEEPAGVPTQSLLAHIIKAAKCLTPSKSRKEQSPQPRGSGTPSAQSARKSTLPPIQSKSYSVLPCKGSQPSGAVSPKSATPKSNLNGHRTPSLDLGREA